jgi:uncharacterized protein YbjT (DUF2867 family)
MWVVIFGASGMVGMGTLLECLDDGRVTSVLVIGRRPCGVAHPKLIEELHQNFLEYGPLGEKLRGYDACFFCLGVSAAAMDGATYFEMTYDLTLAAAKAMLVASPGSIFCYVSGQGADSTAEGRVRWARVKGRTENALLRLQFKAAYMLRPGFIQPLRGVRASAMQYKAFYVLVAPLYPLLRRIAPASVTTSVNVGRAMIQLAAVGDAKHLLENDDINRLALASAAVERSTPGG